MGSPPVPSPSQTGELEKEGQLQLLSSPERIPIEKGSVHLKFALPRQGLSLVRLAW
jgi:xylan 1,4-beta-xylosidase